MKPRVLAVAWAVVTVAATGCHTPRPGGPTASLTSPRVGQGRGGLPVSRDREGSSPTGESTASAPAAAEPVSPVTPCATAWCRPVRRGVAVLLPLTGKFRELGAEVRTAIESAAGQVSAMQLFAFYDTGGDPALAVVAAQRAMADGYGVLLGPLGQRETAAVVEAVHSTAIVAHLSPLGEAIPANHVWRWVVGPREEGAWVAEMAEAEQFPTMAVFYPDDETGRLAAASLATAADGSEITFLQASVPFAPVAATLAADVRVLLGMVPQSNADLRRHLAQDRKHGMKTFTPQPGFSLLYVPASYELGALVASYLPYHNVELRSELTGDTLALRRKYRGEIPDVVQLVGPSSWAVEGFLSRAGAAAEGAYLLVPCPGALAPGTASEQIEGALRARLRRRPSELAMQAYDAASLLSATLAATSRAPAASEAAPVYLTPAMFGALTTALGHATLADGACGAAAMTVHGNLARKPVLLTVKDGAIAPAQW